MNLVNDGVGMPMLGACPQPGSEYMVRHQIRDYTDPGMAEIYVDWFFGRPVTLEQRINQHFLTMGG